MNVAIILAGGSGDRMGAMTAPKQFIEVYGKPIVVHTLEVFDIHPEIDHIIVCCREEFIDDLKIAVRKFSIEKVRRIVPAGDTRQGSSLRGLEAVRDMADDDTVVVMHDAVRPLVTGRIISDNIKAAREYGATDTVVCADDTIIKSADGVFMDSIPIRSELFVGQTPQSFRYEVLMEAHLQSLKSNLTNSTDDCRLVLNAGGKVKLVTGDKLNFKITTQEDLTLLKALVKLGKIEPR